MAIYTLIHRHQNLQTSNIFSYFEYEPCNGLACHRLLCNSVLEHHSAKSVGLGFDSSWWTQILSLCYICDKINNICLYFHHNSLTLSTLKSVSIFSKLFSIHFLKYWQGEFVQHLSFLAWQSFSLFLWSKRVIQLYYLMEK